MKKIFPAFFSVLLITSFSIIKSQQFTNEITLTGIVQGSLSWGDYDDDGYSDILISGWTDLGSATKILHNNGDNTFTETAIAMTGVISSSVAWGDCDNDGDLDAIVTGTTTGVTLDAVCKLYRNDAGTFNEISSGLPEIYNSAVTWGDYDRDGDLDILMTGMIITAERVSSIYNNDGNGNFSRQPGTQFIPVHKGYSTFGDYDNDGYPDVLLCGETATLSRVSKLYHNNGDGTFNEQANVNLEGVSYGTGTFADLNNDGYLDLAIIGENASFDLIAKIYINDKNGGFTVQTGSTISGIKYGELACGDYDNDGDLDIFLTGERDNAGITEIYDNDGAGIFTKNESITIEGVYESSVGFCDYDNDGDLDFVLAGFDNMDAKTAGIYRNNITTANNEPGIPANLDYEINSTTARFSWDRVTGDETPSASLTYNVRIGTSPTTTEFVSPQSGTDGKRKVVAMGNTQLCNTLDLNNLRWDMDYYASVQAVDNAFTGGEFSDAATFSISPQQPTHLTGVNLSTTSILLRWNRGNGDKCILFAREGTSGPSSPVNNTTYYANSEFGEGSPLGATEWYCIYKGVEDSVILTGLDPEKDYTVHALELQGPNGSEIYATALNPDNDNLGVFSSGIFTALSGITMTGLSSGSAAWGDYDNDGYLDVLSTGLAVGNFRYSKIYRNTGDNIFEEQVAIDLVGVSYGSSAWGDYNNDDLLDIVITGYNESFGTIARIYKNNGDNTFSWQEDISMTSVTYSSVGWADYDNDGDIDLLIAGENLSSGVSTKLYRNDGNNTFTEQTGTRLKGIRNGSLAWGDYDNDGLLDILLCGLDGPGGDALNYAGIFKNNGDGTFTEQTGIDLTGVSYGKAVWGDYNNDNYLDILLTGASGYPPDYMPVTKIYHNNGDNTFTELSGLSIKPMALSSGEWGDYNNDGLLDILLTGDSGYNLEFKIYLNDGNDGFDELNALNIPGSYYSSTSSADYDCDGDLDILFTGNNGTYDCQVYRNNLYMMAGNLKPNMRPEAPTGLESVISPGLLELSWDGIDSDETFFVNMSYNVRAKLKDEENWKVTPHSTTDGFRTINSLGNTQLNRNFMIKNPESGIYYWQVQAVDQSYSGSEWSEIDSAIIKKTQAFFKTDTVCLGLTTHFTDQSVVTDGIASWYWDFRDGSTSSLQNPEHTYSAAGTYNVKLLVTSNTGDKDSLFQDVIVKARPSATFTAPNVCIGSPTVLTNNTNDNGLTISAWLWEFGDDQTSSLENPGTHSYGLEGSYVATLTATADNGCSDTLTKTVIVAGYPSSSISADNKLTICEGDTVTLTAESDPLYTYQWKMDDNNLTGATENELSISKYTASYLVEITNTLANCITVSDEKDIIINPKPTTPSITAVNYTAGECPGEGPIILSVDQTAAENNYIWTRNGVTIQNSVSAVLEGYLEPGNFTVTAEKSGCASTSEIFEISSQGVPDKPVLFARGPNIWYLGCNVSSATEFKWYYNDDLIVGANENYYVANQNLGTYFVRVKNADGCFSRSDALTLPTDDYLSELKEVPGTDDLAGLNIFPNPSPGVFNLQIDNDIAGELNIEIITREGKKIYEAEISKPASSLSHQLDLSGQSKGLYIIQLKSDKKLKTHQIIVK